MSYRPSATPPTTGWARRLDEVMRERGLSRVALFEEVGSALGYAPKSRSAFLKLLEDREPTATQAAVLATHFGEPLTPDLTPPSPVLDPMERIAAALERIADNLAGLRGDTAETAGGVGALGVTLAAILERMPSEP